MDKEDFEKYLHEALRQRDELRKENEGLKEEIKNLKDLFMKYLSSLERNNYEFRASANLH